MLVLKRMIYPYEVLKCKMSGKFIVYGDFYYEDDEDKNLIISAVEYNKIKKEAKLESFDYSLLAKAQNQKEYRELVKRAERDYLRATILDRPIFDQGHSKKNGME